MALEPKTVTAGTDAEVNAELRDMKRRFRVGAALTLSVFFLAMAPLIPVLVRQSWADSHSSLSAIYAHHARDRVGTLCDLPDNAHPLR